MNLLDIFIFLRLSRGNGKSPSLISVSLFFGPFCFCPPWSRGPGVKIETDPCCSPIIVTLFRIATRMPCHIDSPLQIWGGCCMAWWVTTLLPQDLRPTTTTTTTCLTLNEKTRVKGVIVPYLWSVEAQRNGKSQHG